MMRVDLDITLTVQGPMLTKSSAPGEYGIDAVFARTIEDVHYLPGTLLVGKLRQSWDELRDAVETAVPGNTIIPNQPEIDDLLGRKPEEGDFTPYRKRLFFEDLTLVGPEPSTTTRYRIQINPASGAVDDGQLMTMESPFACGESFTFQGRLIFLAKSREEAERIRKQVLCGLQWTPQLGAFRSIGFGRLLDAQVEQRAILAVNEGKETGRWAGAQGFDFILSPRGPFCVAGHPKAGNIFESREEISGGVVKGCLAETINRLSGKNPSQPLKNPGKFDECFAALRKNFAKIHISHAFPAASCCTRPLRYPLSLVKADGLFDVALLNGPSLINGHAPDFSVDWKDASDVTQHFGWPDLSRELRVRTAIDRNKLRQEDEALFAHEMIVPGGHCWCGRVNVSDVDAAEQGAVLEQLAAVLQLGLLGMGKTKTIADVLILPEKSLANAHQRDKITPLLSPDNLLILTLQTPALLLNPETLAGKSDRATLHEAYKTSWDDLAPSLALQRFFARQELSGGLYQHSRFQKDKKYRPWLLTTEGSVFVFSVNDHAAAQECVQKWLVTGLPLPASVLSGYELPDDNNEQWQSCPFIRQNGFGEIAVNLDIHETHCALGKTKCEKIKMLEVDNG